MSDFWAAVEQQCTELRTAKTADDVLRILSPERNPDGRDSASGQGFFAGSGGDTSLEEVLDEAGWRHVWRKADYYWVMQGPTGDVITYVEGDVYRGNTITPSGEPTD